MKEQTIAQEFTSVDKSIPIPAKIQNDIENYSGIWHSIKEDDAAKLFAKVTKLFNKAGLKFSLCFGSLLGCVREGGLIKGDEDVDIFVWDEQKLWNSLEFFHDNGLKTMRIDKGVIYSFYLDDCCYIDVYILAELTGWPKLFWGSWCYGICKAETPKEFFKGFKRVNFLGSECDIPINAEDFLELWYWKSWRTPIRGRRLMPYKVRSAYVVHKFLDEITLKNTYHRLKRLIKWAIGRKN